MAISNSDGSQTATISTEHTLATITTAGSFVILIDTANMTAGDRVVFRAKTKVRSVGTTRLSYEAVYANTQGEPVKISIPIASANELVYTLEQTAGTGRDFPWEIVQLDA